MTKKTMTAACILLLVLCAAQARETVVETKTGVAIQRVIDAVAADGGGRVTLTNGVYTSATLYLKSGIELHLAKDAVLRGADNPNDYDDVDDPRIKKAPERSKKAFIVCLAGVGVSITGEGTVDGQGPLFYDRNVPPGSHFRKPPHPRPRMVQFWGCTNVCFSGVTFKDSPGWTFWLRMCEDVKVERVAIVGDQRMINNDGLHFDGCRRMRVFDSTIRTGDDCIVMRANRSPDGDSGLCEDLLVENCALDSSCQAIRLGCPSDGDIRNGCFRKLKITGNNGILSNHPLGYLQRGSRGSCSMKGLLVEDCDIVVRDSPIVFRVDNGVTLRDFGNVTFRDVRIDSKGPVVLQGNAESPLKNIRFENVRGHVESAQPIVIRDIEGLAISGFSVTSGRSASEPFTWDWKSDSWECIP